MTKRIAFLPFVILLAGAALLVPIHASAQPVTLTGLGTSLERLPTELLEVTPPSAWVQGAPGEMRVHAQTCRSFPPEAVRRRIVDVAVQEWAFFGFPVLDRLNGARLLPPGSTSNGRPPVFESSTRRAPVQDAHESGRVAASIAGYWAVTPEGPGIVQTQNQAWNGRGVAIRWTAPWSAAFISWVMCEGGLGERDQFRRAIAHRTYIDQAIRARDGQAPSAAYVAYDIGEQPVEPGDLLCSARRPQYRNIHERRTQLGVGARTHCDVVVQVDAAGERILAIGGNVLRAVSLKVLGAHRTEDGEVLARSLPSAPLFAHLKLRADPIEADALLNSPTLSAFPCGNSVRSVHQGELVLARLEVERTARGGC